MSTRPLRILWMYKYMRNYNFDNWLHMHFADNIKDNDNNIELKNYGFNMQFGQSEGNLINYRSKRTMEELHKIYPFDVVICNTKSRMFEDYLPWWYVENLWNDTYDEPVMKNMWLPKDFDTWKGPKIMLEEDYHYEKDDSWYAEKGFDVILQRHFSQVKREESVRMRWFPFSVDTNIFKPEQENRENAVCFAGSGLNGENRIYLHRRKVCETLTKQPRFLTNLSSSKKGWDYVKCLQQYVSHINGSSIMDITSAKMFEIIASGSILFTDESDKYGLTELFPDNSYITYKQDGSDAMQKADSLINGKLNINEMREAGLKCIREKHSHPVRIEQLKKIINEEFNI